MHTLEEVYRPGAGRHLADEVHGILQGIADTAAAKWLERGGGSGALDCHTSQQTADG
jgi:hypothetical protein